MPFTELKISMLKSFLVVTFWVISSANIFSIIASLCAAIYFFSMLKVNVIDKHHDGNFFTWIKSLFKFKK